MMNSEDAIIEVKNLVAKYGENLILDDVGFEVMRGEIFVILGPSGCGKSTLMRHMIGLDAPAAGQIILDGDEISHGDRSNGFERALRKIGVLFQGSALLGSMTLGENIALPLKEYTNLDNAMIDRMIVSKLCSVGLGGYEHYYPAELSGGMKKRAGLARAMSMNPLILFLDEPSAGLDPVTAAGIDELIIRINQSAGTTIVIVTHELESVFKVAHRVIMLDREKKGIIDEGDPRKLRDESKHPFVRQFFRRQPDSQRKQSNEKISLEP